jgi:hypothetical protein
MTADLGVLHSAEQSEHMFSTLNGSVKLSLPWSGMLTGG